VIVVTTPTGKIGSQVVKGLLDAGETVRVIVRDAAKLTPGIRERVEAVEGSHDDVAVVAKATEGAESFFCWCHLRSRRRMVWLTTRVSRRR
jgi:uncharacterized protein YbjT (DUF2867 family)